MTEPSPANQNALRLLQMVAELHKEGYQRIRISPGLSPSGLYWRCSITHVQNMKQDGWDPIDRHNDIVTYSSSENDQYFGWTAAAGKSPIALAKMFIERYPEIVSRGKGLDPKYTAWLKTTLEKAQQGEMPVLFADYDLEYASGDLPPPPNR